MKYSVSFLASLAAAAQYSRRGYYDDVACAGNFVVGISVPVLQGMIISLQNELQLTF